MVRFAGILTHPFVVEPEAFDVTQIQKAQTKPPVTLTVSDAEQPVSNNGVFFIQLRLIAITTFADSKELAGKTHADVSTPDRLLRHLLSMRWLHHFFAMAS